MGLVLRMAWVTLEIVWQPVKSGASGEHWVSFHVIPATDNGLEKLRETKQLVDELKAQLAVQERELDKKNAEADALIEKVGVETKKVCQEKSAADEEKLKVDQITRDVTHKQKDCQQDLQKRGIKVKEESLA